MKVRNNIKETIKSYINNNIVSNDIKLISSNIEVYYINKIRVLKNYNTIISLVDTRKNYNKIYINSNKYSKTTSKNQNLIKYYATIENMEIEEIKENELYKLLENE